MRVNSFDGGLSLRIDPSLIRESDSQRLVNVDADPLVLKSEKDLTEIEAANNYIYNFKDVWQSSANYRDYVEYEGDLYYTEENGTPKRFDGTTLYNMGIESPPSIPAVDGLNNPIEDQQGVQFKNIVTSITSFGAASLNYTVQSLAVSEGDLTAATYSYKITVVSNGNDVKEISLTHEVTGDQNAVRFTFQAQQGVRIRIYRDNGGTYYRVSDTTLDSAKVITDKTLDNTGNTAFTSLQNIVGTITYTVTYYNEDKDIESAPMTISNETVVEQGDVINISKIPVPTDAQVTGKRLYRNGGNLTQMTKIADLDVNTTTFDDYTADIDATEILATADHIAPENDLQHLAESYGVFFGGFNNELRFSEVDKPYAWPPKNSITFRTDITGVLPVTQGVLIFTLTETFLLTGTTPADFTRLPISQTQGCLSNKSCQNIQNIPMWVSYDGICTFQNGRVIVYSRPQLGKLDLTVVDSIVFDERYFIVKDDGNLLVLDMRSGVRFYELDYDNSVTGIAFYNGDLFYSSNAMRCTAFTGSDLTLRYTSPVFVEGDHTQNKTYNDVYIRYNGTFTVKLYIDDTKVHESRISGNTTARLTAEKGKQRGYGFYIEIEGKGTVYSIKSNPKLVNDNA